MEWQRQVITMLGVDESDDPRVMAVERLLVCENGFVEQGKAIRKRNGFTPLPRPIDATPRHNDGGDSTTKHKGGATSARGLFSTGEELCIIGSHRLYGLTDGWDRWQDRGPVSPCGAKAVSIYRDATDHSQCDLDRSGGFVCYAARRRYKFQDTTLTAIINDQKWSIELTIKTISGQMVTPPLAAYWDESSSHLTLPHSPRVCHTAPGFRVYWSQGADVGDTSSALRFIDYTIATQKFGTEATYQGSGAPITTMLDTSGRDLGFSHACRHFDAIGLDRTTYAGGHCVAYIDHTAQTTTVDLLDASGTLIATATIGSAETEKHYLVALCESPSTNDIFVMVAKDAGAEGFADTILLYKLGAANLLPTGPTVVDTLVATPKNRATNISLGGGIVYGDVGQSVNRQGEVALSWGIYEVDSPELWAERAKTMTRTYRAADVNPQLAEREMFNCLPVSRPWFHNGRAYQWWQTCIARVDPDHAAAALAGTAGTIAFEAHFMVDLMAAQDNPITATQHPAMVGLHSIGTAPPFIETTNSAAGDQPFPYIWSTGNCSTVAKWPGANDYRHASITMSAAAREPAATDYYHPVANTSQREELRFEALEVSCDFDAAIGVATAANGAVVIGGACVTWYAGDFTEELGYAVPPMIAVESDATSSYPAGANTTIGSLPLGTYTWQAYWESYDSKGYLHRSHPSAPVQFELTGAGNDTVNFKFRCSPATNRYKMPGREMGVRLYRAAGDGNFRTCQNLLRLTTNDPGASYLTAEVSDWGLLISGGVGTGTLLYTNGGVELENVAPEGARFPAVAGERLWLASMVRRERLQYSKRFTVVTATEDLRAPELNEGFGLAVPDAGEATGMAVLDDKVILFTADRIYAITGAGPDDGGGNNDFSALTPITSDGGCVDGRSIVSTPHGVFFQHQAGLYLLDRGMSVSFVGDKVRKLVDAYSVITSGVLVPAHTQVRFTCNASDGASGIVLVFDYTAGAWSHWTLRPRGQAVALAGACLHGGVYHVATTGGVVYREDPATWRDDGTFRPLVIESAWAQGAGQSGWQRMRKIMPLLDVRGAMGLSVTVYRDFAAAADQVETWTAAQVAAFVAPDQVVARVKTQQGHAYRVRIEDTDPASAGDKGEGYTVAGITLEYGVKRGVTKLPSAQHA